MAFRKMLEKEARGVDLDIAVPKFKQRKWQSDAGLHPVCGVGSPARAVPGQEPS